MLARKTLITVLAWCVPLALLLLAAPSWGWVSCQADQSCHIKECQASKEKDGA